MHIVKLILSSYLPEVLTLLRRLRSHREGPRKATARYCYSVWLRHLVTLFQNDVKQRYHVVMELGPGDSIGVGLAALLTGTHRYIAYDIVRHMDPRDSLPMLNELTTLIGNRAAIPDDTEFPDLRPRLDSYRFPYELIEASVINDCLDSRRIARIRRAVAYPSVPDPCISYVASWGSKNVTEQGPIDMVFSQAVLEHVDDLDETYRTVSGLLRSGGVMSHQIDYRCHGTASQWNGHWTYPDFIWRMIRGRRSYLINREPHSKYVDLLNKHGFKIATEKLEHCDSQLNRAQLAERYRDLSDNDLTIQGACIQAQKP